MLTVTQCPCCRCYQWAALTHDALHDDWRMTCFLCGPVRWRVEVRHLPDVTLPARRPARRKKAA